MKKILIDGYNPSYNLAAVISDGKLCDIFCENSAVTDLVGNVYLARISTVMESISAYFVDFGREKNGFLPFSSCNKCFKKDEMVIVQIRKNEKGDKGPKLSTFIKLVGRYYVFLPNGDKHSEGTIINLKPKCRSYKYIKEDLISLENLWHKISAVKSIKPVLLHQEYSLMGRMLRDRYFDDEVEIIVEGSEVFKKITCVKKELTMDTEIVEYISGIPIFAKYNVFAQIKEMISSSIRMTSGGSIVIDATEALTSIDVNSSSHKGEKSIEETSYRVNLEAAAEVARQIRLRDISGLIAIDFIDMQDKSHIAEVESVFRVALDLGADQHTRVLPMNEFCVLMMSRQRVNQNLHNYFYLQCAQTKGFLRTKESIAFEILFEIRLSLINPKSMTDDDPKPMPYSRGSSKRITVECSSEVAEYLLNDCRRLLNDLEVHNNRTIFIRSNATISSDFKIDPKHTYVPETIDPPKSQIIAEISEFELPIGFFPAKDIPIYLENSVVFMNIS